MVGPPVGFCLSLIELHGLSTTVEAAALVEAGLQTFFMLPAPMTLSQLLFALQGEIYKSYTR